MTFVSGSQRAGQAAFNALEEAFPQIASVIRGTDEDPFYDDSRLTLFYRRVAELLPPA